KTRKIVNQDKLQANSRGLYKIVSKLGELTFIVQSLSPPIKKERVGARLLRLYSRELTEPTVSEQNTVAVPTTSEVIPDILDPSTFNPAPTALGAPAPALSAPGAPAPTNFPVYSPPVTRARSK